MKVRYNQEYTDEYNDIYPNGCVAEHTDAEAGRRIALGVCEQVDDATKALRYQVGAELVVDACVPEELPEPMPFVEKPRAQPLVIRK